MAINIQPRTDYSFMFASLGSGAAGTVGSNFLLDYANIKNGSYGKLLKAYYNQKGNDFSVKKPAQSTVTEEQKTNLPKVQSATDALKESADKLLVSGSKSVFQKKDVTVKDAQGVETTKKEYDVDAIYKAVNDYVTNYNSVVKAANDSENDAVVKKTVSLANATFANIRMLNKVGIRMNEDSTLSIDKDAFKKADMDTVKNIFTGAGSYGYRASAQASLIDYTAEREASRNNLYTMKGTLNNAYNVGNLFDSIF